ncbi:MAG TPA: MerR family transcriptional regulator [Firmicutes bacterium]|nr:MerR family transcriptional regulator [Bacillota bacterium]
MTYTISQVARMFHLQPSTLRYYEAQGLLTEIKKTPNQQRIYEDKHIKRLRTICCFKRAGMTIRQLQEFFAYEKDLEHHCPEIIALLEKNRKEIAETIATLKQDYQHLLRKIHFYTDTEKAIEKGEDRPAWKDYRDQNFPD